MARSSAVAELLNTLWAFPSNGETGSGSMEDKVVHVDYPASVPNFLYLMMIGQRPSPEDDPYQLDGFDREVTKWAMKFLLNTKGLWGAELALSNWINTEAENPEASEMLAQAIQKIGSSRRLLELVIERN